MKKIDFNNWKRKDQFKHFASISNPYYVIGFNLDVTKIKEYCVKHNASFYRVMIYCVSEAVNKTEEFLYCYKDGDVYRLDHRRSSYTLLDEDEESFRYMYAKTYEGFDEFIRKCEIEESGQEAFIDEDKEGDDLIYITCLPWIDMTFFTNARDLNNRYESIPMFAWGKYKLENDKYILNMSLEVNHAFIDGFHIEKLVRNFDEVVNSLGE